MRLRLDLQHEPWLPTGDSQTTPLSDGEVLDALVPAHNGAILFYDVAWDGGQPLLEEGLVIARGNETDVLAVRLGGIQQLGVFSYLANLRLGVCAHGHQRPFKLFLTHAEQHVRLVLG